MAGVGGITAGEAVTALTTRRDVRLVDAGVSRALSSMRGAGAPVDFFAVCLVLLVGSSEAFSLAALGILDWGASA